MANSLVSAQSPTSKTQPVQVTIQPSPVESPSAWMQYGTSPTEIILATAVVIGATASVIVAISLLLQVLVPVLRSQDGK